MIIVTALTVNNVNVTLIAFMCRILNGAQVHMIFAVKLNLCRTGTVKISKP